MPTKSPRINMVLEEPLYKSIERLAAKDGVSISQKARDLILDSLETLEDIGLDIIANERMKTYKRSKALTLSQMKKRLGIK